LDEEQFEEPGIVKTEGGIYKDEHVEQPNAYGQGHYFFVFIFCGFGCPAAALVQEFLEIGFGVGVNNRIPQFEESDFAGIFFGYFLEQELVIAGGEIINAFESFR
jgi:hypothetical protein